MALNFKVIMAPSALNSLDDIRDYIERKSGNQYTANKVAEKIIGFMDNFIYNPFMGRAADDEQLQGKNIRRITALNRYNIFYRVDEQSQTVYILKIADGRQSDERQLFGL